MKNIRVGAVQMTSTLGGARANAEKIVEWAERKGKRPKTCTFQLAAGICPVHSFQHNEKCMFWAVLDEQGDCLTFWGGLMPS